MKNRLPRPLHILTVEPFKIASLWSTGEFRFIDFAPLLAKWKATDPSIYAALSDFEAFKKVEIGAAQTFTWPNVNRPFLGLRGVQDAPLELDPDELFRQSVLLTKVEPLPVGSILRAAREKAGLSQTDLAAKSGTTRHYISRLENGQSGFHFDTLEKIVQLGMGKKMKLEIV